MLNRFAWLAGVVLTLGALNPLQAQVKNPDCTGWGYWTAGARSMSCAVTGCTNTCVFEVVSTPWGPGTGTQCRCDYIGPPPNCCRLTAVKFPGGGVGFTTQGQRDFPSCMDTGSCWLASRVPPGTAIVEFFAICTGPDYVPQYGVENVWKLPDGGK